MYGMLISGFAWVFIIGGSVVGAYVLYKLLGVGVARLQKMISGK